MPRLLALPRLRTAHPDTDRDLVRRFAAAADPDAFAELVRRHGPTVLGVCRRAARDPHLADDAFQATFLVLARKAGSLRDPAAVGSWLFGVARRVATAAEWADLLAVLDEELARLPDQLRAPLLACYLDGRTQDEAARHLGVSLSTLRRRLDLGRELLRVRMTARGATLGAGLFGGVLVPAAAVPAALARAVVDHAAGGPAPARVLALAATGPAVGTWAAVAGVLVAAGGLALGLGAARPATGPPAAPPAAEAPPPRPADRPDPLPQGAVARMGTHRFRHPGWPRSLQYGLGGQVLVSVGRGPAVVWDARTGEARRTIGVPRPDEAEVGQTIVEAGRVLADGRSLLLYGNEVVQRHAYTNRGFVWDLERDAEARAFRFGVHKDRRMFGAPGAFAADGSAVAEAEPGFGDDPGTVWLWGEGGKPTGRLAGATTGAGNMWGGDSFALSPDGKLLYVIRPDHSVAVWDVAGEKPVRTFGGGLPVPSAFAVSPDGQHLAIFAAAPREKGRPAPRQPEAVRVWDPAAGKLVTAFEWEKPAADDAWMLHVGFLPDGSVWAAADAGAVFTFRQWDRATGQQVRDWTARLVGRTAQVAVSPDGGRVAVAIHTGLIRVFDAATGRVVSPDNGHQAEVTAVRFTPDGKRLVTVSDDGTARTWDAATGAELRRIDRVGLYPGLSADAGTVFAPDRPKWEAAGRRGLVARDTATGRELWRAEGLFAAFPAPDGRTAVAFERGAAEATLIDLATGRVIRPIPVKGTPLTIGPGGRMAVYAEKNAVSLWDLTTGRRDTGWDAQDAGLLRSATSPGLDRDPDDRIEAAALSPDGKRLAVVVARGSPVQNHEHGCVYVCAATTGEVVWRAKSDFSLGRSAAFSPDGAWVAVAGDRVRVFDAATGGERPGFDGHRGAVQVVAFSPDGTRLATGGADGTAVVWEVPRR